MDKNQKATLNDLVITQAGENKGFLEQVKQTLLIVQELHYTFLLLVGKYEKGEESQKELLQQAEDLLKIANGNLDDLKTLKEEFNNEAKEALRTLELLSTEATQNKEIMLEAKGEFEKSLEDFTREKGEFKDSLLATELLLENITNTQEELKQSLQELSQNITQNDERLANLSASLENSETALANVISEAKDSIATEAQRLKEQLQGILEQIKQGDADISVNAYDDTELRGRIESLENAESPSYDDTELRGRIESLENSERTPLEMSAEFLSPIIQNTSSFLYLSNEILKAGVIHA